MTVSDFPRKQTCQFSGCVLSKNHSFGNNFCTSSHKLLFAGNLFDRLEFLTVFDNFFKKFSLICLNQIGGSLVFCKRIFISLGSLVISNFSTLLSYFTREKTKVLGHINILKSYFLCRISIANLFNIKYIPPALAGPLVVFNQDIKKLVVFYVSILSQLLTISFEKWRPSKPAESPIKSELNQFNISGNFVQDAFVVLLRQLTQIC